MVSAAPNLHTTTNFANNEFTAAESATGDNAAPMQTAAPFLIGAAAMAILAL